MNRFFQLSTLLFLAFSHQTFSETTDELREKIHEIVSTKNAIVGVSIIGNEGKDTLSLNGNRHFPLQSVFKFHIALTVLSQIDKGVLSLNQKISVPPEDMLPGLWSPLREENPKGGDFTIAKLIKYSVSKSDNVGCDVLLRLLGGPHVVEEFFKKNNITDIAIKLNEEDMQSNWDLMFQNWTTPKAASATLEKFYNQTNKLLSEKSYAFIWKTMKATETGQDRLKGLLPRGTVVAHKTGSSGTNEKGITEAVNDIGIVFLPNGDYFIISVFVSSSTENDEANAKIIAEIAKATWDYYVEGM